MKFVTLSLLICSSALATGNHLKMKVIPLNSPVSEAAIIFKLEPPKGMAFVDVNARIKNQTKPPFRERIKDYPVEKIGDQILLKLPTRDYPVDKYEILVYTKNDNRKIWEFWKKVPPLAFGKANFEVKTHQIIVDGDPQPPHPGDADKETLLGIDSDNDGVNDALENWINETYQTPAVRKVNKEFAKVMLLEIKHNENRDEVQALFRRSIVATFCLRHVSGSREGSSQRKKLEGEFLNTSERIKAYVRADRHYVGSTFPTDLDDLSQTEINQICNL